LHSPSQNRNKCSVLLPHLCYTERMNTFRLRLPLASNAPRPTVSFPNAQASRKESGWGVKLRLHCDCELSTVNFKLAAPSRLPTLARSSLAGGGTVPCSHRHRRKMVLATRLPAKKHGAHAANQRQSPVFPPATSAEVSPFNDSLNETNPTDCSTDWAMVQLQRVPMRICIDTTNTQRVLEN